MKIEITLPTVSPMKLSGAALRSMEAADKKAIAAWTTLQTTAQVFSDTAEVLKLDLTAINLQSAYDAKQSLSGSHAAIADLAPRWNAAPVLYRQWVSGNRYETPLDIITTRANQLDRQLTQAGIPHPTIDHTNLTQWLSDLQSMGVE